MSPPLAESSQKVQSALRAHGLACEVIEMPGTTRTAQEAAAAIGCQLAEIAKSLVFRAKQSDRAILVIASGVNRVDEKKLGQLVGEPVERASPEFVRERTGFVIGGVPPCGHLQPLETYLDEDLLSKEKIWAAAGTPFSVFKLTPADLERITPGSKRIAME
jgi:prolyl-tRNA editing enzyme YbaK/EbsC (Cys-tRNA(Pro) deacylase)